MQVSESLLTPLLPPRLGHGWARPGDGSGARETYLRWLGTHPPIAPQFSVLFPNSFLLVPEAQPALESREDGVRLRNHRIPGLLQDSPLKIHKADFGHQSSSLHPFLLARDGPAVSQAYPVPGAPLLPLTSAPGHSLKYFQCLPDHLHPHSAQTAPWPSDIGGGPLVSPLLTPGSEARQPIGRTLPRALTL